MGRTEIRNICKFGEFEMIQLFSFTGGARTPYWFLPFLYFAFVRIYILHLNKDDIKKDRQMEKASALV